MKLKWTLENTGKKTSLKNKVCLLSITCGLMYNHACHRSSLCKSYSADDKKRIVFFLLLIARLCLWKCIKKTHKLLSLTGQVMILKKAYALENNVTCIISKVLFQKIGPKTK